jgi:hypothetical protein
LEHTQDYSRILEEFARVVRPGGTVIVSFDISLDGDRDISISGAIDLLGQASKIFESISIGNAREILLASTWGDSFTTKQAQKLDPSLLPWRYPSILYKIKSRITNGKALMHWPPRLAFCCFIATKA